MKFDIYSAIGNSVRSKLIMCLSSRAKNVTELISNCNISQSAVSQHLSKLKKSGLVDCDRRGKEIYYFLKYRKAAEVSKLLISLDKDLENK